MRVVGPLRKGIAARDGRVPEVVDGSGDAQIAGKGISACEGRVPEVFLGSGVDEINPSVVTAIIDGRRRFDLGRYSGREDWLSDFCAERRRSSSDQIFRMR
jgi:hypothetical protein